MATAAGFNLKNNSKPFGGFSLFLLLALLLSACGGQAVAPTSVPCEPAPITAQMADMLGILRPPCAEERFQWPPDVGREYNQLIRFNNFGLNAPDYTLAKPDGVFRIVIVGDSFSQGVQVAQEQGFPWLLQQALKESGKNVEIINLSMDAYGTDRELLMYALVGWQFQPDLVLLSVYPANDVQDNQIDLETRRYGYRLERPFFTLDGEALALHNSPTFDSAAYADSAPYAWLTASQAAQLPAPPNNLPARPAVVSADPYTLEYPVELGLYLPEDTQWGNAWALTEKLFVQFRDLVTAQDIPFAAVIIPDRRAVHTSDWEATLAQFATIRPEILEADPLAPGLRVENFLIQSDVPVFNLTPVLRLWAGKNPDARLYYQGDGHFNPEGHAQVAQEIATWLRNSGLVP